MQMLNPLFDNSTKALQKPRLHYHNTQSSGIHLTHAWETSESEQENVISTHGDDAGAILTELQFVLSVGFGD